MRALYKDKQKTTFSTFSSTDYYELKVIKKLGQGYLYQCVLKIKFSDLIDFEAYFFPKVSEQNFQFQINVPH